MLTSEQENMLIEQNKIDKQIKNEWKLYSNENHNPFIKVKRHKCKIKNLLNPKKNIIYSDLESIKPKYYLFNETFDRNYIKGILLGFVKPSIKLLKIGDALSFASNFDRFKYYDIFEYINGYNYVEFINRANDNIKLTCSAYTNSTLDIRFSDLGHNLLQNFNNTKVEFTILEFDKCFSDEISDFINSCRY